LYFQLKNSSLNSVDIFFVKIGSISSEKSVEKSAIRLFHVFTTKFAAFFHIVTKSKSSFVLFI
jgi:hypothetical protein